MESNKLLSLPREQDIIDRFLSKTKISDAGCWEWTGALNLGYGVFGLFGVARPAHRVSWGLFKGELPKELFICHKCDNRKCVNPDHLFLGTHQDNMDDMVRKGRTPNRVGSNNGFTKLTEREVRIIRAMRNVYKVPYKKIQSAYGLSLTGVRLIVTGQRWKHV